MTTSSDVALDIFYALKPAKYAFMESLSLKQSLDPAEWDGFAIVLQLASSAELSPNVCICNVVVLETCASGRSKD